MSEKKETETKSTDKKKEIREWILTFLLALALALLIRTFLFEFVVVKQSSMYPNLVEGNRVGIEKINKKVTRGDIVVIKINEEKNYIKRVIATEGETVQISSGVLYINNQAVREDYLPEGLIYSDFGPETVKQGCIFVMGDNRPASVDSRSEAVGQIKKESIIGKAIFRLYPFTLY